MFLGSSCVYPKKCPQPMKEEYLMSGKLEETNIGYSLAKIAGLQMCAEYRKQYGDDFISVMPCNVYGKKDNFSEDNGHVVPAMIRKFYEAKINHIDEVELWGTGSPRRELIYSDDLADAIIFLMDNYSETEHINIGTGTDISILDLAYIIKNIVGYEGSVRFNPEHPDGTMLKRLDTTKINSLGWKAKIPLVEGLKKTYEWFLVNYGLLMK